MVADVTIMISAIRVMVENVPSAMVSSFLSLSGRRVKTFASAAQSHQPKRTGARGGCKCDGMGGTA
jgi:hypothetical protein